MVRRSTKFHDDGTLEGAPRTLNTLGRLIKLDPALVTGEITSGAIKNLSQGESITISREANGYRITTEKNK